MRSNFAKYRMQGKRVSFKRPHHQSLISVYVRKSGWSFAHFVFTQSSLWKVQAEEWDDMSSQSTPTFINIWGRRRSQKEVLGALYKREREKLLSLLSSTQNALLAIGRSRCSAVDSFAQLLSSSSREAEIFCVNNWGKCQQKRTLPQSNEKSKRSHTDTRLTIWLKGESSTWDFQMAKIKVFGASSKSLSVTFSKSWRALRADFSQAVCVLF